MTRSPKRLLLLCALCAAALLAPAAAEAAQSGKQSEGVTVKRYLMGRVKPNLRARGTAHLWTNTGFSNRRAVYPVLRHQVLKDGTEWIQVLALRNRTQVKVWVPKWATRKVVLHFRILVDISSRRAKIYRDGKIVRRFKVVVGAPSTPTPTGHYYVVDRMHLHTSWAPGKWALATSAFSRVLKRFEGGQGQVALHAKGYLAAPLGAAASHGCVRFANSAVAWLARKIPNGTPVDIKP